MDRRSFLLAAAAAPVALRRPRPGLAFVTADLESHVAVVDLDRGAVVRRIATRPGPRSIERVGESYVVAHTAIGEVSVLGRHLLEGFEEPRYAAAAPDGRHAFVTDSGRADLAVVDVVSGVVVTRLKLRLWPRHLALSRDGRTLWVGLGTASEELAVVDVADPRRPRLTGAVRPGFLAHDVGFAPDGRVWVTAGEEPTIAVYERGAFRPLPAGSAPQHVSFLGGRVFVTSGDDGTLHVQHGRTTRVPVGSYNVQHVGGRIVTPSLNAGTLCVLDAQGRLLHRVRVASSSHDAA
jgi:DNA-binding beta-propeller fold protein YncE